jgi:hypothetical protein
MTISGQLRHRGMGRHGSLRLSGAAGPGRPGFAYAFSVDGSAPITPDAYAHHIVIRMWRCAEEDLMIRMATPRLAIPALVMLFVSIGVSLIGGSEQAAGALATARIWTPVTTTVASVFLMLVRAL